MQGGGGRGAGGGGLNFAPVTDGRTLPADPFVPAASAISADVPVLVGCTETESTWNTQQQYDPLTDAELRERVAETLRVDEPAVEQIIAVYKKNQPKQSNLDIYLILASDATTRAAAITQAERKAALVLLCYKMEHSDVELFCGYAIRARPTGETLCGIHGWPGESRRAR